MNPDYLTSCPDCGAELRQQVKGPLYAPWECEWARGGCGYAFWPSQLTREGRLSRRPLERDHAGHPVHGWDFHAEMVTRMLEDRSEAIARGTSALPEFLNRLDRAQLAALIGVLAPRAQIVGEAFVMLEMVRGAIAALRTGV